MRLPLVTSSAVLLLLLSACEVAGAKRSTDVGDDSVIMTYFISNQYAFDWNDGREALSSFFGRVIAATPESNFDAWENPTFGCDYSANDGVNVGLRRTLDVGAIALRTPGEAFDLERLTMSGTGGVQYRHAGFLGFGTHNLSLQGRGDAARYSQVFSVLDQGGGINVTTGSGVGQEQRLPSPALPVEGEAGFDLVLDRSQNLNVGYEAPTGTRYVRLRLHDGSGLDDSDVNGIDQGDITCYGSPNGPITLYRGYLNGFRPGVEGAMELSFVSTSLRKEVARVKESIVVSSTTHLHGVLRYYDTDGLVQEAHLGSVEIR